MGLRPQTQRTGCAWLLLLCVSTAVSVQEVVQSTLQSQAAACPLPYQRQSLEDITAGAVPYLFGGDRDPCGSCRQSDVADFCQFHRPQKDQHRHFQHTAHICSQEQQQQIQQWALKMGFHDLLQFTPCDFWPYLEDRSLWILGDSQGLDLWIATVCFLREFWALDETGVAADDQTLQQLHDLATQHLLEAPRCAELLQGAGGRVCFMRVNTGEQMVQGALRLLPHLVQGSRPIVVANFGLWHHEPGIYRKHLAELAELVHVGKLPLLFWKDTNPQHFNRSDGAFVSGEVGSLPYTCQPLSKVTLRPDHSLISDDEAMQPVLKGLWRNEAAREVLGKVGVPFVETFNDSLPLWNFHRSNVGRGMECGHYCHPSAPQLWVHTMYEALRKHAPPDLLLHDFWTPDAPLGNGTTHAS